MTVGGEDLAMLVVRAALGVGLVAHARWRSAGSALGGRAEMAGGALLLLGLVTPVGAAVVVGVAVVEGWRGRGSGGVLPARDDYERLFLLGAAAAAIALAFAGAGRLSGDHALDLGAGGVVPGVLAVALGLVSAAAVVGGRERIEDPVDEPSGR